MRIFETMMQQIAFFSALLLMQVQALAVAHPHNNKDSLVVYSSEQEDWELDVASYVNRLDSFFLNQQFASLFQLPTNELPLNQTEGVLLEIPDSIYAEGLTRLDVKTPFELAYNPYVRAFIELYLFKKRDLTERCMGLSGYYFPVFEELLDKYDLPIEFKYLAIVESALNNTAKSRAGAAGLWQFMYRTGKFYGLEINSYIDERYEVYKATDAACRYFKDMYAIYGNWELVIAAYNCGPGNVNKAIRRSGGKKDYWEIRQWLPRETRGYVPAFIAVNYAMNYAEKMGLQARHMDTINLMTDTLCVKSDFKLGEFCQYFCANPEEISYLNPALRRFTIPDDGRKHTLTLPLEVLNAYLEDNEGFAKYTYVEPTIMEEVTPPSVTAAITPNRPEAKHVVKSGEVLGTIAAKYGVSIRQIMDWNNLYSSRIKVGQVLAIYPNKEVTTSVKPAQKPSVESNNTSGKFRYHVVKPGDTLWDIANMYEGVTVTELKKLNKNLNHKNLKPGSKIIVSTNG